MAYLVTLHVIHPSRQTVHKRLSIKHETKEQADVQAALLRHEYQYEADFDHVSVDFIPEWRERALAKADAYGIIAERDTTGMVAL